MGQPGCAFNTSFERKKKKKKKKKNYKICGLNVIRSSLPMASPSSISNSILDGNEFSSSSSSSRSSSSPIIICVLFNRYRFHLPVLVQKQYTPNTKIPANKKQNRAANPILDPVFPLDAMRILPM